MMNMDQIGYVVLFLGSKLFLSLFTVVPLYRTGHTYGTGPL